MLIKADGCYFRFGNIVGKERNLVLLQYPDGADCPLRILTESVQTIQLQCAAAAHAQLAPGLDPLVALDVVIVEYLRVLTEQEDIMLL
ncbi:hypothetical protein ABVT39_024198 [Epinephelus coioides]